MKYSFLKPDVCPDSPALSERAIPRKIWQTCQDIKTINPQLIKCISALKEMNPGWEHQIFDDESQYEFIKSVCSDRFVNAYDRIQPLYGAARADMFRYLLVFLKGGAYFDLKSGTRRPLDEILRPDDTYIIPQWDNGPEGQFPRAGLGKQLHHIVGGEFEQWLVIAAPGHPFLAAVIEQVLHNIENYNAVKFWHGDTGVLNVCGPHAYTLAIAPLLKNYPHRQLNSWREGLLYTQLADENVHRSLDANHYGKVIIAPVTSRGLSGVKWVKYWLAELVIWPLSRLRSLNHTRLRKRRARRP